MSSFTLLDINECEGVHGCQQICVNTPGSHVCQCSDGFVLTDGTNCEGML